MYLLRRTAARALSSTPSKSLFVKPRSITTYTPAFQARQQGWIPSKFQRRYASDEAAKTETAESAAAAAAELAQTKPEAPVEENLTPVQQNAQHDPTDASATVTADALSSAADRTEGSRPRRRPQSDPPAPSNVVYVGNLFYEVGEEQLKRIFSRFGNIKGVRIVRDSQAMSKGFGYVNYENVDDARAAIDNLNMQVFEGRNLVVQFHRVKANNLSPRTPKKAHPPSRTIFIGNMAFEMSDKDLNDMFRDIRNVTDVRVAIDRRTGQPRGFAHADFVDVPSAQKAMEQLKGQSFYGRTLSLDFSDTPTKGRSDRKPRDDSNAEQSSSSAEKSSSNAEQSS